ncbi:MAG: glycogen synthase [Planctomycetes bacterium]|nr:glycogen synthase [Planctomycetota bacterium]
MRIMQVAAEATPYVKVGGLADVAGALAGDLAALGCEVELVLPRYRCVGALGLDLSAAEDVAFPLAGRAAAAGVARLVRADGVTVTLVDAPWAFDRDGVYDVPETGEGHPDNPERFACFARAVAGLIARDPPDVVHVHDCHAALVPGLLRLVVPPARPVKTVLTIHNLAYQMLSPPRVLFDVGFPRDWFRPLSPLEFHGGSNFLKVGIHFADLLTTVSTRYAEEIQTPAHGCGLDGLLRERRALLHGVLNGIDTAVWDPATDPLLPARYSAADPSGKWKCRRELLRRARLPQGARAPLVGMVGRLAEQKGLDIFAAAAPALARLDLRFAILGVGQEKYHRMLRELASAHPERFAVFLGFDDELAHWIEAGSDFFLMPSRYEPCGLNQMYSMRYGSIPIVHRVGGLAETVTDYDESADDATGFAFAAPRAELLVAKARSALALYREDGKRLAVMRRGMARDFSARRTAERYLDLYTRMMVP